MSDSESQNIDWNDPTLLIGSPPKKTEKRLNLKKMTHKVLSVPADESSKNIFNWKERNLKRWVREWNNFLAFVPNKQAAIRLYKKIPVLLNISTQDKVEAHLLAQLYQRYEICGQWLEWWTLGNQIPLAFLDQEYSDYRPFASQSDALYRLSIGIISNPQKDVLTSFYMLFHGNPSALWVFCEIIKCREEINNLLNVVEVQQVVGKKAKIKADRHAVKSARDLQAYDKYCQIEPGIIAALENIYPSFISFLADKIISRDDRIDNSFDDEFWQPFLDAYDYLLRSLDRNPRAQVATRYKSSSGSDLFISGSRKKRPSVNKCNNSKKRKK